MIQSRHQGRDLSCIKSHHGNSHHLLHKAEKEGEGEGTGNGCRNSVTNHISTLQNGSHKVSSTTEGKKKTGKQRISFKKEHQLHKNTKSERKYTW